MDFSRGAATPLSALGRRIPILKSSIRLQQLVSWRYGGLLALQLINRGVTSKSASHLSIRALMSLVIEHSLKYDDQTS
jgi:hypothetical protein